MREIGQASLDILGFLVIVIIVGIISAVCVAMMAAPLIIFGWWGMIATAPMGWVCLASIVALLKRSWGQL